jgi:hypothetical protein
MVSSKMAHQRGFHQGKRNKSFDEAADVRMVTNGKTIFHPPLGVVYRPSQC